MYEVEINLLKNKKTDTRKRNMGLFQQKKKKKI